MSTEVGPKTGQIYTTRQGVNDENFLHFDSSQNLNNKQELGGKAVVSNFPKNTDLHQHCQAISRVNNSHIQATHESQVKAPFVPAVKVSDFVKAYLAQGEHDYSARYAQAVGDALTLSKTELQRAYPAEYNSLRKRRDQAKERHIKFADSLKDIRDWIIHLGPRPYAGLTVDRIKSAKGYVPNNLRWATKTVQTQNRNVTKWHQLPDGSRATIAMLANKIGLSYNATWKRLKSGKTVASLLGDKPKSIKDWTFPKELALYCESRYHQNRKTFTTSRLEWFIDHLDSIVYGEKRGNELSLEGLALPSLTKHLVQARQDRQNIIQAMKNYEESKLKELIAIYEPTDQAISQPVPANDTTPQQPLPVAAQARHQPKPRPLPDVEQPYRPSPAEVGEMMTKLAELAARPVMAQ